MRPALQHLSTCRTDGRGPGELRSQRTAGQETTARTSLYKTNFSPVLDGRAVEKRKKPVPEGPCADDGFTASVLRPFGYRLLNEAAGRHAVCCNVDWSRGKEGRFGQATRTRSKSKARPKQVHRETATLPLRGGFVQVPETRSSSSQKRSERGREVLATR